MDDWDHRIRLRELFTGALPGHWGKGLSSSSDETTPGYCVQFWASQHSKDVAKWAGSAEGPYAGRGQHHLHCEHRLREWGLFKPGENVSTRRPKGSLLTHTRGFWRTQSWAIYGGAHWDSEMQQTLKKKIWDSDWVHGKAFPSWDWLFKQWNRTPKEFTLTIPEDFQVFLRIKPWATLFEHTSDLCLSSGQH